jgi:hypothetical protein
VRDAGTALAAGIYALATNLSGGAAAAAAAAAVPPANASLAADMLACLTVNARCPLFARVLGVDGDALAALVPAGPLSAYTSVYNQPYALDAGYVLQPSPYEAFVRNFLGRASATQVAAGAAASCASVADCAAAGRAYECLLGACVVANAFYHDALSPALASPAYGVFSVPSPAALDTTVDPLWTEPYWSGSIGATSLLVDSAAAGYGMLGAGRVLGRPTRVRVRPTCVRV